MKRSVVLLVLFLLPVLITAQNINGRFSSSVYSFERFDTQDESDRYLRTFQSLILNANQGKFSLRTRLNLEADIGTKLDNDPRLRFYNLYFEGRKLWDLVTFRIGRQSLFNTIAGGVYDGAYLELNHSGYKLSGLYGGNVPAYQKLELTDDWGNDYVLGAKFVATSITNTRIELSYIDKNYRQREYTAIRMDENFNPIEMLIQRNSSQYKFVTGKVSYSYAKALNLYARYDYDLNFETTSKFEVSGAYDPSDKIKLSLYYNYREPRIRYNSIFSVFNYGNTQEIEGGIDYRISPKYTVLGKFANVTYEGDSAQRLTLGFNTVYGNVSYRKTFGYAGELDAVSVYTARSFMEGFITPSLGFAFTTYKLTPEAKSNDIITLLAGTNVRPWKVVSFDLQLQYLNNKIYNNDVRFLFKLNYWFNTNI